MSEAKEPTETIQYDICFIVGACTKGKYLKRLNDFAEFGILNHTCKVCVDFLFNTEDEIPNDPNIAFNRDRGYTRRCYKYPTGKITGPSQNTSKFCQYLLNKHYPDARWYIRIDDDSLTDVGRLLHLLDTQFIPGDHHFLIADRLIDMDQPMVTALSCMGVDITCCKTNPNNGGGAFPFFVHEWEFGCFSANTFHRALADQKVREVLAFVSQRGGNTDQITALMARMVGVHAVQFPWASPHGNVTEFSGAMPAKFDPRYCHIHYMARDISVYKWDFFREVLHTGGEVIKAFQKVYLRRSEEVEIKQIDVIDTTWDFYFAEGKSTRMHLNHDGTIGLHGNDNEKFWRLEDGLLIILNRNRAISSIFWAENEKITMLNGIFLESFASLTLTR